MPGSPRVPARDRSGKRTAEVSPPIGAASMLTGDTGTHDVVYGVSAISFGRNNEDQWEMPYHNRSDCLPVSCPRRL